MDHPDGYPEDLQADVLLRDGRPCHLRPITPQDAPALAEFHRSLSPETVYLRFFAPYPELSERDLERFTHVDYVDRMALVATQHGSIVGVGRYDRIDDHSAEIAFTIRDDHQGRGLGSVLLEHLAAAARENGIDRFVAEVLPSNQRMIGTFVEAGYRVNQHFEEGVIELEFDIEPTESESAVMQAREHAAEARSVEALLYPRKVVVIGVSRREGTVGQLVVRNLRRGGFTGSLYAVHPEVDEVAGIPAYRSVADAPGPIDLAIVTAPIDSVQAIVDDCAAAGVRALEVISSGFSEYDPDGPARAAELVSRARESGVRVVGPEALGIINTDPRVQLNASLAEVVPSRGRIGFFCESGTLGATFLEEMSARQLGLSTFVSPGMRVDVSGNDLLQYWESDESTSVVLLYLQGLGNPRKFARIVRRLSRRKPVLAVLTGRVHGSGEDDDLLPDQVVDELLTQCGVLQTRTIGGLLDVAALLAMQPIPRGDRVALVSNSTALLMHTMDLVDSAGMHTVQRPYRVHWDAGGGEVGQVLSDALAAQDVDAVIVIHVPPVRSDLTGVTGVLRAVAANSTKPVLAVLPHETGLTGRSSLVVNPSAQGDPGPGSVPVYGEPAAAVAALSLAVQHAHWLATPVGDEPEPLGVDRARAESLIDATLAETEVVADTGTTAPLAVLRHSSPNMLSQQQTGELFAAYGLELWPSFSVSSEQEAADRAAEIGYPVVLKTESQRLVHRTDLGGVRLSLENERSLRTAYLSMVAQHPSDVREHLVVQAMAPAGVACSIVTREDPAFGPVMSFTVGGVVSDLVSDHAYWMPPLTDLDAERLIRTPRTSELLFGYQGSEPANVGALAAVLMRVALMAEDWPQINTLEINPVLATPTGCYLLGASVELRPAADRQELQPRRM
ncbi:MAG: GNAT family N-acetyltransferase [Actinobacteria bacterium]|nr:GNAT family N-acetyltransferase [Actinomycetota bacterium]MCB9412743.1 GNAT family N-acetyltransferase [Actinomycetota bacterium]